MRLVANRLEAVKGRFDKNATVAGREGSGGVGFCLPGRL
jgi:hypothetical protein